MKKKSGCGAIVGVLLAIVLFFPLLFVGGCYALYYYSRKKPSRWRQGLAIFSIAVGAIGSVMLWQAGHEESQENTTTLQANMSSTPSVSSSSSASPSSTSSLESTIKESPSSSSSSAQPNSSTSEPRAKSSQPKSKKAVEKAVLEEAGILPFTGKEQLVLQELDALGRAHSGHMQLQDKDEPTNKRAERISIDPVGWHNYRLPYGDGTKKAWVFNRGHLLGYQFSGLNDEARNLVPMTAWLNTGNVAGMDAGNTDGMLYYEDRLDSWLGTHPHYWLDYQVTAIYQGNELLPRQIELQYVGLDANGELLEITLGGKEKKDQYGVSHVVLDNQSPNAQVDYATGMATGTVAAKAKEKPQPAPSSEQAAEDPIVYVASQGRSDAYWYDIQHMPATTNFDNAVTMKESEALALGKHHSMKE